MTNTHTTYGMTIKLTTSRAMHIHMHLISVRIGNRNTYACMLLCYANTSVWVYIFFWRKYLYRFDYRPSTVPFANAKNIRQNVLCVYVRVRYVCVFFFLVNELSRPARICFFFSYVSFNILTKKHSHYG